MNKLALILIVLAGAVSTVQPLAAKTRKGDKLLAEGRVKESRKDFDGALEVYEQALSEDPGDPFYQLCVDRVRFQAGQAHVTTGLKLRQQGKLTEALIELQKGFQIDPSSSIAEMEIRRTQEMINREKKKVQPTTELSPEEKAREAGLTPAQVAKKEGAAKLASILPVPELRPIKPDPINLVLRNQPAKVLFETVGKMAGINVLFDQDFVTQSTKPLSIDITNSSLEQALDYLGVLTKGYWKALSPNTIFVTQDNTTKRRDYEEQVMKVFYLNNVNTPQELQEIVTCIRSVADLQRLFVYNAQNAIVARGEADRIALAEKIINDLDKPKSEVVVDIVVMQASTSRSRELAINAISGGLNVPINFTPNGITATTTTTTPSTTTDANGNTITAPITSTNGGTTTTPNGAVPLSRLSKISTNNYSVTLPSGLVEAMMSDSRTRILQTPQVRAVDAMKAVLKIGQKVPTASGSFQPGIGGVGINPLVNTQFTYIDVGVNVDLTPHIHDNGEVDLHVEVEISSVDSHVNLGGIDQPVIGQRKVTHDIRMKEGEVNVLGGLMQFQETKTKVGIPGLSSIPVLGKLFTSDTQTKDTSELCIALIPHIVRRPEITAENLRSIAVGNQTVVHLSYGPRAGREPEKTAEQAPAQPPQPAPAPAAVVVTPVAPAAVTPPVAAPSPAAPATQPVQPPPPPGTPPAPAAAPAAANPAEAPKAILNFSPAQVQAKEGGTVNVSLVLSNASDLASMPLTINFEPKVLQLADVIRGPLWMADNMPPAFTKNVQNESGTASISFARGFGMKGLNGNGVVLTLVFQAVARGASQVTVSQAAPRNAAGDLIPMKSDPPPQTVINVQ